MVSPDLGQNIGKGRDGETEEDLRIDFSRKYTPEEYIKGLSRLLQKYTDHPKISSYIKDQMDWASNISPNAVISFHKEDDGTIVPYSEVVLRFPLNDELRQMQAKSPYN